MTFKKEGKVTVDIKSNDGVNCTSDCTLVLDWSYDKSSKEITLSFMGFATKYKVTEMKKDSETWTVTKTDGDVKEEQTIKLTRIK